MCHSEQAVEYRRKQTIRTIPCTKGLSRELLPCDGEKGRGCCRAGAGHQCYSVCPAYKRTRAQSTVLQGGGEEEGHDKRVHGLEHRAEKKKQQNPCISPLVVPRKGPPKEGGNPFPLLAPATFLPHQLLTQEQGLSPGGCSLTQTSLSRQQQEAGASNTPITHR